jgi:UDP-N-acetylmuramate--alanine ligase
VILHRIYPSARELDPGTGLDEALHQEVERNHPQVRYFAEPADAVPFLKAELRAGDLFLTMGAGDNWKIGRQLFQAFGGGQ